jgi:hypothetical protein
VCVCGGGGGTHWSHDRHLSFDSLCAQAITGVRDGKPTCASTVPVNESCAYPDLGLHDDRHIFFCEPGALRNELDFSPEDPLPFTTYTQVRGTAA